MASPFFFFFNDTTTTEIYPLPILDALPISLPADAQRVVALAHVVVGIGAQRHRDWIISHARELQRGRRQRVAEHVPIDRACYCRRQCRIVVPVGLRLMVRRDRSTLPADAQR